MVPKSSIEGSYNLRRIIAVVYGESTYDRLEIQVGVLFFALRYFCFELNLVRVVN